MVTHIKIRPKLKWVAQHCVTVSKLSYYTEKEETLVLFSGTFENCTFGADVPARAGSGTRRISHCQQSLSPRLDSNGIAQMCLLWSRNELAVVVSQNTYKLHLQLLSCAFLAKRQLYTFARLSALLSINF